MTAPHPPRRAALTFIFVTVVLDSLAMGIVIPVLPILVKEFEGGDSADAAATMIRTVRFAVTVDVMFIADIYRIRLSPVLNTRATHRRERRWHGA